MENSHELIEKFCDTSVTYLWHIIATAPNRGLPTPKITRDFSLMLRWQTHPSHNIIARIDSNISDQLGIRSFRTHHFINWLDSHGPWILVVVTVAGYGRLWHSFLHRFCGRLSRCQSRRFWKKSLLSLMTVPCAQELSQNRVSRTGP